MGVIHRNLTPLEQADQVREVKRYESGMVINPIVIHPDTPLAEIRQIKAQKHISGFPVVERGTGKLVGILTNRDVRFRDRRQLDRRSTDDLRRDSSPCATLWTRARRGGCCVGTRSNV